MNTKQFIQKIRSQVLQRPGCNSGLLQMWRTCKLCKRCYRSVWRIRPAYSITAGRYGNNSCCYLPL